MIFLVLTSIASVVVQNGLFNYVTKKNLREGSSIMSFNVFIYSMCVIAFGILLLTQTISLYTIILGLIFGVVTLLSSTYKLFALSKGPMHVTLLFNTSAMIIPTMSGVFFGEKFSVAKLMLVFVLLFFLYLSFKKTEDTQIGEKWFFYSLLAFLFQGAIGVLQKVHQASKYKSESSGFLFVAFICATLFCFLKNNCKFDRTVLNKKMIFIGLLCGICSFAMNFINLKLSGLLPSQLFFPLINGSAIVLSSAVSVVLFRERITKRQTIGLVGGILTLIGICIVP